MDDQQAYQLLIEAGIRFVSLRPRSQKELHDYLQKKLRKYGSSATEILEEAMQRLGELGYVDDEKFIRWWIQARQSNNPKGMRLIEHELREKGVNQDLIESVVSDIIKNNQLEETSELEVAKRAVERKIKFWVKLPKIEQKKKIYGFLGRRGFSSDIIYRIIDEVLKKDYNF